MSADLDPVLHAPLRLRICAFLSPLEEAEFRVLREELEVSESVLSEHLGQLVHAGYVALDKMPDGGRRRTWARLTGSGRTAFAAYAHQLRALLAAADA